MRSGTTDATGVVRFSVVPPANTRLYAAGAGCDTGGSSEVLNVRPRLSLFAARTGPRAYVFRGWPCRCAAAASW